MAEKDYTKEMDEFFRTMTDRAKDLKVYANSSMAVEREAHMTRMRAAKARKKAEREALENATGLAKFYNTHRGKMKAVQEVGGRFWGGFKKMMMNYHRQVNMPHMGVPGEKLTKQQKDDQKEFRLEMSKQRAEIFQLASGVQDFFTVLGAGGSPAMAMMGLSNNLGVLVAQMGPVQAAFGTLGVTILPALAASAFDATGRLTIFGMGIDKAHDSLVQELAMRTKNIRTMEKLNELYLDEFKTRKEKEDETETKNVVKDIVAELGLPEEQAKAHKKALDEFAGTTPEFQEAKAARETMRRAADDMNYMREWGGTRMHQDQITIRALRDKGIFIPDRRKDRTKEQQDMLDEGWEKFRKKHDIEMMFMDGLDTYLDPGRLKGLREKQDAARDKFNQLRLKSKDQAKKFYDSLSPSEKIQFMRQFGGEAGVEATAGAEEKIRKRIQTLEETLQGRTRVEELDEEIAAQKDVASSARGVKRARAQDEIERLKGVKESVLEDLPTDPDTGKTYGDDTKQLTDSINGLKQVIEELGKQKVFQ